MGKSDLRRSSMSGAPSDGVRKGRFPGAGWVLLVIGAIAVGLIAALSRMGSLVDIGLVVMIVISVGAGAVGEIRAKKNRPRSTK